MKNRKGKIKRKISLILSVVLLLSSFIGVGPIRALDEEAYEDSIVLEHTNLQKNQKTIEDYESKEANKSSSLDKALELSTLADNFLRDQEVLVNPVDRDLSTKSNIEEGKNDSIVNEENPKHEKTSKLAVDEKENVNKELSYVPDNPDHLTKPYPKPSGKIGYDIYPETDFLINLDQPVRKNQAAGTPSTGKIDEDHPQNPGDVMLFKEAKAVPGKVNTWDVTLRIEGKDTSSKTSDVVLVIDRSGSMKNNERMTAAKNAANEFVSKLLPPDTTSHTTRIAVVSFASDASTNQALTNNVGELNTAINGLRANGGTFTQAGIKQAEAILEKSGADNKHIILLSDGEPTFSYEIENPDNFLTEQYIDKYSWGNSTYTYNEKGLATNSSDEIEYNYPKAVGTGTAMFHRYATVRPKFYNHGNSAIAEAKIAGKAGYNVFTIGLQTNTTGSGVLNNMTQGSGTFTDVKDVSQLTPVFETIAGQIASAARDATVSDPMGQGFTIPDGATNIESIPETPAAEYDPATKKITWNPGTLTTPIEPGSDIKYAQIKYTIEIDDDILDAKNEGGKYATNGDAKVTYTDANGKTQTVLFPKPKVDPVLWIVDKQILDHKGDVIDTQIGEFGIKATNYKDGGVDPEGKHILGEQITDYKYTDIIKMDTRSERKLITNLRNEGYYKIEETTKVFGEAVESDWKSLPVTAQYTFKFGEVGEPGQPGYIEADKEYKPISEEYEDKQAFWVHNDEKGYASQDVSVRITNQLKPINIVIEKSWDPKKPEQVEEGIKFELQRKIESGEFKNVIGDDDKIVSIDYKDFKNNRYTIEDLPRLDNNGNRYIYKVIEKLPENSNYTSVEDGTNPKTKAQFEGKDEVTFKFTNIAKTIDIPVEKTWEDEDNKYKSRPDSIRVQLYKDGKPIEGKTLELKASDNPDENWKGVFEKMPYKENGKKVKYSVKEVEVPTGYKEEITGDSLEGFTIKNTLQYSQVKLKKTVSGNMYDSTSEYKFTYEIVKDGVDGPLQSGSITLKKDGLSDPITVPVGYKLVFKEDIEGFKLKPTVTWQGGEENTIEYTWENKKASEEPVEIVVNNDFTVEIPTGITNPTGTIFVALGLAVAGLGYYLFTRKKRNLEI